MTTNPNPVLSDGAHILKKVQDNATKLTDHLIALVACKNVRDSVFKDNETLTVSTDDNEPNVVVADFAGTTVRFQLFLGFAASEEVVGRVICSLQYDLFGKPHNRYLGDFTYSADGKTNFDPDQSGKARYICNSSDLIVAHFLRKAHEQNMLVIGESPGL